MTMTGHGVSLNMYVDAVKKMQVVRRIGRVRRLSGLSIEVSGIDGAIGELCVIFPKGASVDEPSSEGELMAEVVAIGDGFLTLMPYGSVHGIGAGCDVMLAHSISELGVDYSLLGRVIDGFGKPLDEQAPAITRFVRNLRAVPLNPMTRPRIDTVLETGVRAIDALLTIGKGQRVGIFAGSGVGKSTLLGMIARHIKADVNVIALIGERGREVKEFIDKQLGEEGLKRSVVVVATSDQPALARIRAAYAALAIAEFFRDEGKQVLLTMDSITRFAMAKREIGLSAGEPPTARGYTPSVFAELPELCERCGTSNSGGAISALLTVLVEGDDMNEPISDSLRSILDGHIVLSRDLAHKGQYPAIDILKSVSRVMPDITSDEHQSLAIGTVKQLAIIERNRQMVDIGAYESGSNPILDNALKIDVQLQSWLKQREGGVDLQTAVSDLAKVLAPISEVK